MTVEGTVTCLQPTPNAGGATTMSCALGLQRDADTAYALQSDDPTLIGTIPTGTRVRVHGQLVQKTSNYNAAGIIVVDKVEKL
jgi:hypothetical protein